MTSCNGTARHGAPGTAFLQLARSLTDIQALENELPKQARRTSRRQLRERPPAVRSSHRTSISYLAAQLLAHLHEVEHHLVLLRLDITTITTIPIIVRSI